MSPLLAFMCTGPSVGFDPVCDPVDSVVLLIVLFVLLVGVVVSGVLLVRRWRRGRGGRPVGLTRALASGRSTCEIEHQFDRVWT